MKSENKGFTLVEVTVVLVILGVLAAFAIPALLGWIDKSRNQDALLEARNAVSTVQSIASDEFAEQGGRFSNSGSDFSVKHKDEIKSIAGGTVDALAFLGEGDNPSPTVVRMKYTSSKDVQVTYDSNRTPAFSLDGEVVSSTEPGAPTHQNDWASLLQKALEDGSLLPHQISSGNMEGVIGDRPKPTEKELAMLKNLPGGIKDFNNPSNYSWAPREVTEADNLGNSGYVVALCPTSSSGINLNAPLVYYGGSYYVCLERHSYQGLKVGELAVSKDMSLSQFTDAPSLSNYDLSSLGSGQKIWVKYDLN